MFVLRCKNKVQDNCQIEKARNKQFPLCHLSRPLSYCYSLLPSFNMNQVPEHLYLVSERILQTFIQPLSFDCSNRTSAG